MSFYRSLVTTIATFGIATAVFAADENNPTLQNPAGDKPEHLQIADTITTDNTADEIKVDINKGSAKELMKVKGMSAGKAKSIISYRKKHGDFKSVEELKNVKGFKRMKLETLKTIEDQLTI